MTTRALIVGGLIYFGMRLQFFYGLAFDSVIISIIGQVMTIVGLYMLLKKVFHE